MIIKLNRECEHLEDLINRLEMKIDELEEKKQTIIDNASDKERELTKAEERRIEFLDERIEELDEEADGIQNALDYLRDWDI